MAEQAEFIVRLIDRITAPARAASGAVSRLSGTIDKLKKTAAFKALDDAGDKILRAAKNLAIGIGIAGAAAGAFVVKRSLEMGVFAERARLGFASLTHSVAAGNDAFERSVNIAKRFGFDVEFAVKSMLKLRAAQFTIGQAEELMGLSADLKAIGSDAQQVESAIRAITQIKAKGRLQAEELVGQLAEAGVATTLVYAALGKQLGKTDEQVRKLITAGKISADVGIEAIKKAILAKVGGTKAGEVGERFAHETLTGALDRLKAAPGLFFLRVSEAIKPALGTIHEAIEKTLGEIGNADVSKVADFVVKVVNLLPQAIALAKEFGAGFSAGFGDVLSGLDGLSGVTGDQSKRWFEFGKAIAQGFGLALKAVKMISDAVAFMATPMGQNLLAFGAFLLLLPKLVSIAGAIASVFGVMSSVVGAVSSAVAFVAPAISTFVFGIAGIVTALGLVPVAIGVALAAAAFAVYHWWDDIVAFFSGAGTWLFDVGGQIMDGLADGIASGLARAIDAMTAGVEKIKNAVKVGLGIASPSKVMRELGAFTGEGFAVGIEDRRKRVDEASRRTFQPTPEAQAAVGRAAGGSRNISITVNVKGGTGGAQGDSKQLGATIAAAVKRSLQSVSDAPAGA